MEICEVTVSSCLVALVLDFAKNKNYGLHLILREVWDK